MSMTKIYICEVETGEYKDYSAYPVRAFASEDRAKKFCARGNKKLHKEGRDRPFSFLPSRSPEFSYCGQSMSIDCLTGGKFRYYEIDFDNKLG